MASARSKRLVVRDWRFELEDCHARLEHALKMKRYPSRQVRDATTRARDEVRTALTLLDEALAKLPSEADEEEREFAARLREIGFPSYGIFCKHGHPGGLFCIHCGTDPDRLPQDQKLSGKPGVPLRD